MSWPRLLIFLFVLGLLAPLSSVLAETIVIPHQYAWSNNIGWISFASTTVGDGALGGFAWSANKGFIKLNPAQGGVLNDGTGDLSGFAWGEQLGWIDFNNVAINANGKFTGSASSALVGTITFDCNFCDVETDWRPLAVPPVIQPVTVPPGGGGGGGGGGSNVSTPPSFTEPSLLLPEAGVIQDPVKSARAKQIDIIKDGVVNILDFNALIVNWGRTEKGNIADINGDGVVDIFDFNLLMVYWGITYTL